MLDHSCSHLYFASDGVIKYAAAAAIIKRGPRPGARYDPPSPAKHLLQNASQDRRLSQMQIYVILLGNNNRWKVCICYLEMLNFHLESEV